MKKLAPEKLHVGSIKSLELALLKKTITISGSSAMLAAVSLTGSRALLSGTRNHKIAITTMAIGTLIKKAQRQEACSMSQPPRIGPRAPVMAVQRPSHSLDRPRQN